MAVAVPIVFGMALRLLLLTWPTGTFDSDEAIVGLMARHFLYERDLSVFFYGQAYGGSLEPLLTVAAIAAAGSRPIAVKAVPLVLSALSAVIVWRVGRRAVDERAGVVAAAAFWIWPANYVWFSTKARGFYWAAMVLGLLVVLLVLRIAEEPRRWRDWLLLGCATGLGWWTTPQILYFVLPGGLWLLWRVRAGAWRAVAALPTALLGAAPWLIYNFDTGWRSLEVTSRHFDRGYLGNIGVLFTNGLPVALGLHAAEHWLVPVVFPALYAVVLATLVLAMLRRPHTPGLGLVALAAATYPVIWGALPVSGVVGEGRYVLFLAPFLAVLLARLASARRLTAAGFVGAAAALSLAGAFAIRDHSSAFLIDNALGSPEVILMPRDTDSLVERLEEWGVTHAYADYWIAYRVTFETGEKVIVAPLNTSRYPPYDRAVDAARRPAYLFVTGAPAAGALRAELRASSTPFYEDTAGDFTVIWPRRVSLR